MPFDRPTLAELTERIRADFRSRLSIVGSLLRRFMAGVLAVVWAGAVHELHGHIVWAVRQLFPATAEREYLLRAAAFDGLTLTPATYASGQATATGTNGTLIPTGTVLVRDDGFTYTTTADATIAGGTATVLFTADLAGDEGNIGGVGFGSDTLELESPIAGVTSTLTVSTEVTGGNDEEDIEDFRARYELSKQTPPTGGSDGDYEMWALEVAGVTRAWIYRHEDGLGTVTVRFVRDDDVSIFPDAGEVATVQAYLDSQRPTTAEVTAASPIDLPVAMTIAVTPDTTAVRDAVEDELTDMLKRVAAPGDGAGRGTIKLSQILIAIGIADGVTDFTLTSPAADVVPAVGELATLGTITWT